MIDDIIEKARQLRKTIENLAAALDDDAALDNKELFPAWDGNGVEYKVGKRVRYGDNLYKVLQAHTSQFDWNPVAAPSLFARMLIPDPSFVPVWQQPDSTNPYMIGDRVRFPGQDGHIYQSLLNNNVWSPQAYPAGWLLIE